jgi:hypothetical protein
MVQMIAQLGTWVAPMVVVGTARLFVRKKPSECLNPVDPHSHGTKYISHIPDHEAWQKNNTSVGIQLFR